MNTEIPFRSPQAGFDDPVEMWLACHQRVQRFTAMLGRLERHLQRVGADEEARSAASSIRRYFNEAAPRHHEDEEVDMFPRLRALCGTAEPAALEALARIEAEHLAMNRLWRDLDAALAHVCTGEVARLDSGQVAHFRSAYDAHIEVEEQVVLPAMKRMFGAGDWQAIGRAMAQRRGLEGGGPAA